MTVSGVEGGQYWYKFDQENGTTIKESSNNENILGKDAFLKLLVTQLRNQDPLNPMDDKEFIAQMAQFSTIEQINNMDENLQKSQLEIKKAIENLTNLNQQILQDFSNVNKEILGEINDTSIENFDKVISEVSSIKKAVEAYTQYMIDSTE